ncbi:4-amino-4-deoxychorismate lyase [Arachidicoccus rhizosphaerae]|uniref:4-amino-4-deoxychorismate lyase n=1 Tax=Arachidicoccus rhizosphaerae TaxID=551991 RepID=A0A1H4A7S1_9BACT|nr:aminotransferase class IV [Arachidicoccus rhizosphaerae]SEA31838.1 4-amino-4-deoxychorismate lyase [Arachidicoccus rhizosphaerae]
MYPFLESIRLEQNRIHFLPEHEQRFRRTQLDNWDKVIYQDLEQIILGHPDLPEDPQKYKCRLVYSETDIQLNFIPYQPRIIQDLKIVEADQLDYRYKSTDRSKLDELTRDLPKETEILIFKNGLLTDSSFSNLALFNGHQWDTPERPLLNGVHRSYLLKTGILRLAKITLPDLQSYQRIRLINAMMDWHETWELQINKG